MSVQGAPGYGQGYDPYMDYLNSLQYLQQGNAQRGPGLGQTSGANNSILNFPPIGGVAPAAPPKKAGFFGKLKAVVKGVTNIPGNIVKGAVDIVKDPKKLALTVGILALSLNPVTGPIVAPLAIGTALFSAGTAVVKGGMTTYQGWKTNDLQAIEQGVTTAGTGVGIALLTRRGAKSYLGSKGVTIKGTGFKQLNSQAFKEIGILKSTARSHAGGTTAGLKRLGGRAWDTQVKQVKGVTERVSGLKPQANQGNFGHMTLDDLASLKSQNPNNRILTRAIDDEIAIRTPLSFQQRGTDLLKRVKADPKQSAQQGFNVFEQQTARAGEALGRFETANPGILLGVGAPRFNRDALQDYNPFLNQQQALGAGF